MKTPKGPAVVSVDLDEHELATVLSALRFWQQWLDSHDGAAPICDHFSDGAVPLTSEEIDTLCEQINTATAP
jgi:hypothetical protein